MECVVCYSDGNKMYSVGECDHPVCMECSVRMRVLCNHKLCPLCRRKLDKVYFVAKHRPYAEVNGMVGILDSKQKHGIVFEDITVKKEYDRLMNLICTKCPNQPIFRTMIELCTHMKAIHRMTYCRLCYEYLKILPRERQFYTKRDLETHYRAGDKNDQSHRGHPVCGYCGEHYFDKEVLKLHKRLHVRRKSCNLCANNGIRQYYLTNEDIRDHYRDEHYLCEEEECMYSEVASVFGTEIELRAHIRSSHEDEMEYLRSHRVRYSGLNSGAELGLSGNSGQSSDSFRNPDAQNYQASYMSSEIQPVTTRYLDTPSRRIFDDGALFNFGSIQPSSRLMQVQNSTESSIHSPFRFTQMQNPMGNALSTEVLPIVQPPTVPPPIVHPPTVQALVSEFATKSPENSVNKLPELLKGTGAESKSTDNTGARL